MEHEEMSLFPGLSRRDFLKTCGALAGLIGLSGPMAVPKVAEALEQLAKRPAVVWSLFQECLGCSVNLLQSRKPAPANLILQQISLNYHEAVMAAAGDQAEKSFNDTVNSGDFYYIVEGAIATTPKEAITIHGKTAADIVTSTYKKAKATICIGSCSCYGNIQAAAPNPTGAKGVGDFLRQDAGIPDAVVINSPRCPGNADDTVAILLYVLVNKKLPELDSIGRPKFLFGVTVHDNCERRGHFDNGEFVQVFGDEGSDKGWCLYKVGCKGPVTYAPCPKTRWNGQHGWPVTSGGPCIGCAEPDFWDKLTPFYDKAPGFHIPGDITPAQIGVGLGALTAVGIGAHFIGQAATGRLFKGGPVEGKEEEAGPKEGGK
ncbi:MAG: hydrogenase small subunit [Actinobacteria bacterium]|nr:hydrogenase small subunit [Actinomycetota bacterium]